jgi:hypothetical protein
MLDPDARPIAIWFSVWADVLIPVLADGRSPVPVSIYSVPVFIYSGLHAIPYIRLFTLYCIKRHARSTPFRVRSFYGN